MAALTYDPQSLTFVANGQSYMLVRRFMSPANAKLPHVGHAAATNIVQEAVRANPGLAQEFNTTFSHNVGSVFRFTDSSTPVADAILQIQRKELYLLKLGPVAEIPKDVVAAAGGNVRIFKAFDVGDFARAGYGAAAPPIPRDPVDRLILIVQGLADLTIDDVGAELWEKVKGLTEGRVIAALTTAFTAFVMAQLTGPAALLLDGALLGYGLYSLGTGIFQFADDLHGLWDRIKMAQTRADLKVLTVALAVLLAEFAIERIIALLARGGKKKGGGGKEKEDQSASAPAQKDKVAPIQGKTTTSNVPDKQKQATTEPEKGSSGHGSEKRPSWQQSESHVGQQSGSSANGKQKSFKDGKPADYGEKGSVRPDHYRNGRSIEVKNYNVESSGGRSNLVNNVSKQAIKRDTHLPPGTVQEIHIDIRGQNVSAEQMTNISSRIVDKTNGIVKPENIKFIK